MKIFLTGGTGFIGRHVLLKLSTTAHEVTALCRPGGRALTPGGQGTRWLEKSMDCLEASDLEGTDVLIHLASAGVSPRVVAWDALFYWNVLTLVRLLGVAKTAGVRRVVVAGSCAEYGRSADHFDFIPVGAPLLPISPYAASKAAGSIATLAFAADNAIETCYLRLSHAFGEGQYSGNFWPSLRQAARTGQDFPMSPGEQVRDYVPVEAAAAELVRIALHTSVEIGRPLVLNVGTGVPVTLRGFAETWWQHWEAPGKLIPGALPYRRNEPMRFVPLVEAHS